MNPVDQTQSPVSPRPPLAGTPAPNLGGQQAAAPGENEKTVVFDMTPRARTEAPAVQPTIEVVKGESDKKVLTLGKKRVTIGRSRANDLILSDKKTSREHAAIYFEDGNYVVEDLNSTNGVSVNDKLVRKIKLTSDDRITIGDTVLVFTQGQPEISLAEKEAFIQKSDLFNWLDQETKALLAQSLLVRMYPKEATVLRQNTPVKTMYFLYSGEIRIVEVNEEGGERAIDRLKAGDYFGERALLAGESGKYSMIASSSCTLLELPKEQLNDLLQKKPELNQAFYRMVLTQLRSAQAEADKSDERKDSLKSIITSTDVQIIGEDKKILDAKKKIEKLAKEDRAALIVGPPGTGKETFSRYFHKVGANPDDPYVEISVLDEEKTKAGAALFGIEADPQSAHMKGQVGYLEMIGTGTLTISHAELMDSHQQSRLVTYLKFGWFHRNYGQESVKTSTKVVLLANGTETEVMEKFIPELREELEHKTIVLPSLTQRLKDIPILAEHFVKTFARKNGTRASSLSREATEKLVSYSWPGNVKELENVIERSAIVSSEDVIIPGDLIFVVPSEKDIHKINILRQDRIRDLLRHPLIPRALMWFNMAVVAAMMGFTLYGGTRPEGHPLQEFGNNAGMVITWLIWFPILPISAMMAGRVWCGMCPIVGIGDLISRVKTFQLPVPKFIKKMDFWLLIISFLLVDYLEVYFGVPDAPWATGMLLVIIIGLSVVFCVLYERKTFCRYLCPLAGMLGTYATLSPLEVRGNKKICQTQCGTMSCYKGTEHAAGCPMFSYPASLETSTRCMMCMNCVKSCENRGVQINVRPPLQELWSQASPLFSLSFFGVLLVGLMANKQFPNLTYWLTKQQALGWTEGLSHPVLYLSFMAGVIIPFTLAASLSAAASQEKTSENMARYGMAFIPLAFSGHLAHVTHEWLGDGIYTLISYVIKVYDSLVHGIPIGSADVALSPFVNESIVTFLKVMIVLGGFGASVLALIMIARRFSQKSVFARVLPHMLVLCTFWIGYLFVFTAGTGEAAVPAAAAATAPAAQVAGAAVPAAPAAP